MPFASKSGFNQFQEILMGTWTNQVLPNATHGEGGTGNPLSYTVMPIPQDPSYILKNFTYYEAIKFESNNSDLAPTPVALIAHNRGGSSLQAAAALFYGQHIRFADGPGKDQLVHSENGAWLNLATGKNLVGPYPPPPEEGIIMDDPNQQPLNITIAKQMSVPHGNSVLALGSFCEPQDGKPLIPDAPSVLPTPADDLDTCPYIIKLDQPDNYQNPLPDFTANTNKPLQIAVCLIKPDRYIHWTVSTKNQGHTINIPFEQRVSDVTEYAASYWLLSNDGGKSYPYLAYTQRIVMKFTINGKQKHYSFPHVTSNVVTKAEIG